MHTRMANQHMQNHVTYQKSIQATPTLQTVGNSSVTNAVTVTRTQCMVYDLHCVVTQWQCSALNSHLSYSFTEFIPWILYKTTFHEFYTGTNTQRDTSLFILIRLKPHTRALSYQITTGCHYHINIAHSANRPNVQWSVATGSDNW